MTKKLLSLFTVFSVAFTFAQNLANYNYSKIVGTYTPLTGCIILK